MLVKGRGEEAEGGTWDVAPKATVDGLLLARRLVLASDAADAGAAPTPPADADERDELDAATSWLTTAATACPPRGGAGAPDMPRAPPPDALRPLAATLGAVLRDRLTFAHAPRGLPLCDEADGPAISSALHVHGARAQVAAAEAGHFAAHQPPALDGVVMRAATRRAYAATALYDAQRPDDEQTDDCRRWR